MSLNLLSLASIIIIRRSTLSPCFFHVRHCFFGPIDWLSRLWFDFSRNPLLFSVYISYWLTPSWNLNCFLSLLSCSLSPRKLKKLYYLFIHHRRGDSLHSVQLVLCLWLYRSAEKIVIDGSRIWWRRNIEEAREYCKTTFDDDRSERKQFKFQEVSSITYIYWK